MRKEGATMGVNFRNSTNAAIFLVFSYPDFSCTPVNYSKAGWFRVNPGQTIQVWSGFAGGNTFFYYAEDDFGRTWRGSYFTQVPENAFDWCWDTGCTTCRNVGLRRIAVSPFVLNYNYRLYNKQQSKKTCINHTPHDAAFQSNSRETYLAQSSCKT